MHVASEGPACGAVRTADEAVGTVGVEGLPIVRDATLWHGVPAAQLTLASFAAASVLRRPVAVCLMPEEAFNVSYPAPMVFA